MQSSKTGIFLEDSLSEFHRDVAKIFGAISRTCQMISRKLSFRVGMTQQLNPFGERQAELDVITNDSFAESLLETGVVKQIASEEMEKPLTSGGSYSVAMDPLDGSSNIITNNTLGSIFGIWKGDIPQKGRSLVASAFVTYGPTLSLTLTDGRKVDQYIEVREGQNAGRFILAYKDMKLPQKPLVYGFGGDRPNWIPQVERFVCKLEARGMRLRYGGTFIGDYNQVLQRGGIFSYPAHKGKPDGKLRILYETAPVSFINEVAGGASSDGYRSILDIEPKTMTQTSAFYIGNKKLVEELEQEISKTS